MNELAGLFGMYVVSNVMFSGLAYRVASPQKWAKWEFGIFLLPPIAWLVAVSTFESKGLSYAFMGPLILPLIIAPFIWTRALLGNNRYGKGAMALGTVVATGAGVVIGYL